MPEARAPGKLILVGEYAVLSGAPAIAMGVNVWARARVTSAADRENLLFDLATGETFPFEIGPDARVRWSTRSPADRGAVVEAVVTTLGRDCGYGPVGSLGLEIRLDTAAFQTERNGRTMKLGLGSSAAVLVALTGAVLAAWNLSPTADELRRICCAAHRILQSGSGSGVDVVTSVNGGVVGVWPGPAQSAPEVLGLSWPTGVHVLPIWSGDSASTQKMLRRYEAYQSGNSRAFQAHMAGLRSAAETAMAGWRNGDAPQVLQAVGDYDRALQAFDRDAGIGIYTVRHQDLRRLCEDSGAQYKVSGAGGGDFGLAWAGSAAVIEAVRLAAETAGYRVLDAPAAVSGLEVSERAG